MKKVVLFVGAPLVLGGAFVGLAVTGVVKVPGLTPKKQSAKAVHAEDKTKVPEVAVSQEAKAKPPAKPPVAAAQPNKPSLDPDAGAKKLAQYWNNIPVTRLADMAKSFKDAELAKVLVKMDPEKVAELLGTLESARSAKLSRELQKVASVVPPEKG